MGVWVRVRLLGNRVLHWDLRLVRYRMLHWLLHWGLFNRRHLHLVSRDLGLLYWLFRAGIHAEAVEVEPVQVDVEVWLGPAFVEVQVKIIFLLLDFFSWLVGKLGWE